MAVADWRGIGAATDPGGGFPARPSDESPSPPHPERRRQGPGRASPLPRRTPTSSRIGDRHRLAGQPLGLPEAITPHVQ
jgi:hypothetical protein